MSKLSLDYFQQEDVLFLGKNLLGKFLFTQIDNQLSGGMIIETESYRGPEDRASHAYNNKRTPRNEVMFHDGGVAYVYMCYGIHALFNVVTHREDVPHAILIRAIEPIIGIEEMLKRRKMISPTNTLTNGPGTLTQALGITKKHNGLSLDGSTIWIEDCNVMIDPDEILASPRVGIDYAKEDALLPWRFRTSVRTLNKTI